MSTATRRSLSNEARLRPPRLSPVTVGVPDDVWDRWRSADPSSWRWPSPGPAGEPRETVTRSGFYDSQGGGSADATYSIWSRCPPEVGHAENFSGG